MLRSPDSPRGIGILLTPIVFTAFLLLPLAGQFLDLHIYSGVEEKRDKVKWPGIPEDLAGLDAFPAAFDAYYSDQFGMRGDFITWHNLLLYSTTHTLPGNRVIAGKGRWLFANFDDSLESFQHRIPLRSPAELEVLAHRIRQRQDWLAAQGKTYLFFVTPAKSTIYPDRMPDRLRISSGRTRLEQARAWFAKHPDIAFHDTTAAIRRARKLAIDANVDATLYHYTDTHWNALGSYAAFQDVIGHLRRTHPDQPDLPRALGIEMFAFTRKAGMPGDLSRMAGIGSLVTEVDYICLDHLLYYKMDPIPGIGQRSFHISSRWKHLPDLMLFHDSFGESLRLPMSNAAKESWFFWTHDFRTDLIGKHDPRIVMTQITERFFNRHTVENPVSIRLLDPEKTRSEWKGRGDPELSEIRFGSGLVLQAAELRRSDEDLEVRLLWRAERDIVLDGSYDTCVRKDDWSWYSTLHRHQCIEASHVVQGSLWEDRIVFPAEDLRDCESFVLRVEGTADLAVPKTRFTTVRHPD